VRPIPAFLCVFFLMLGSASGAVRPPQETQDLEKWINGPIRYIALKEEMQAFKSLKSNGDRALFIERFWARRDPSPETLTNEYRQVFWERVQQANASFLDSTKPGCMTDRGKIYVLYGPPTDIQEELHLSAGGIAAAGRGVLRWIYEGRPSQRMDLDPIVVVPFERDVSGEYRISYDPKLSSVFFDANAIREGQDSSINKFLDIVGAATTSPMAVMLDLGKMQEVPPQEQVLLEHVETTEAYRTKPARVRLDRYVHPGRDEALLVVTVDLSEAGEGDRPAIIARFASFDATKQPRMLGEDSFRPSREVEARVAQGRILLEPGDYNVTVLVADPVKAETGMFRGTIHLEEPGERLRFSDIVWASTLDSLSYASLASHDEPFHLGPFRVVPHFESSIPRGEPIRLFFEVYGGELPLRVSYQLQGREDDGSWVDLGRPSSAEQQARGQAWELPTTDAWPLGEYRVKVEVVDAEDRLVAQELPFSLVESEEP